MLSHKIHNRLLTGLTVVSLLTVLLLNVVSIRPAYGATTKVEAETYTARSSNAVGAVAITDAGDPSQIGLATRPSEWTSYAGIDLTGVSAVSLRYSNAYAAANVEIRTGTSTGTLLGTCNLPLTGGWSTFQIANCAITSTSGAQTVVLVYQTNFYSYLNWLSVTSGSGPTNTSAAPTATVTRTNTAPVFTVTPTPTRTNTPVGPTATFTKTATKTNSPVSPTATRTNTPVGPTATATATRTVTLTATRTATPTITSTQPTGGGVCTGPLLDPTQPTQGGAVVTYNGHQWQAKWWTQNEAPPGTTGVWLDQGPCTMPTATRTPTAQPTLAAGRKFVGYFAAWGFYNAPFHYVKDLITQGAAQRLTTINYGFTNVQNNRCVVGVTARGVGDAYADYQVAMDAAHSVDGVADMGGQNLMGHWNQLRKLKAMYPNLKVMMSLGGWTWSGAFSDAALPANRQAFVASCVDAFIRGNVPVVGGTGGPGTARGVFDGIDIDWEYPAAAGLPGNVYRPEDTQNFTALLAEFRSQLDAQGAIDGKHYLLTIAAPAGEDKYTHIQLGTIHQYLDWANLMTYDFHGAWDTTGPTNFMAPLYGSPNDPSVGVSRNYNIDYAVNAYIAAGFPASKLVLGLPYYGRGWANVAAGPNNNGLYQSANGAAPSTRPDEDGMEFYRALKANLEPSYTKYYDPITKAMWIYNPSTGIWWSYDDPTSLATKLAYMRAKGLGGAMAWELQADTADGELTRAIYNGLIIP